MNSFSAKTVSRRLQRRGDKFVKLESANSDFKKEIKKCFTDLLNESSLQDELSQSFIHFTDKISLLNGQLDQVLHWKTKF